MADREKPSIADILAQARKEDGGEAGGAPPPVEKASAPSKPAPAKGAATKGDAQSLSVADMLAAARASAGDSADSGEGHDEATPDAPTPSASAKPAGEMSMAEMLAAARGEKSAPAKAKPGKAAPKPKAAAKAKVEPVVAKAIGPKDTGSILAAARKADRSGPMSKAEAADRDKVAVKAKPEKQAPPMPEKPGYARPEPARPRTVTDDRRGFFGLFLGSYFAFGSTALALTQLLWTLGFARFMFPNILTEPPTKFKVGPKGGFAPGAVETKFKAQFGVWVVNALYQGAQIIFALKSVCTHLGCTPNWLEAEQKFKCPCHGSGFYKDGVNFEGPAPRPLERYAISVAADGQLEIDKSTTFQEEKGQWSDSASFVDG